MKQPKMHVLFLLTPHMEIKNNRLFIESDPDETKYVIGSYMYHFDKYTNRNTVLLGDPLSSYVINTLFDDSSLSQVCYDFGDADEVFIITRNKPLSIAVGYAYQAHPKIIGKPVYMSHLMNDGSFEINTSTPDRILFQKQLSERSEFVRSNYEERS